MKYFRRALWMDLGDLQGNTTDGVHVASAGGVWMAIVYGFAGMSCDDRGVRFDPRLPAEWDRLKFNIRFRGEALHVKLTHSSITISTDEGPVSAAVGGENYEIGPNPTEIRLDANSEGPYR